MSIRVETARQAGQGSGPSAIRRLTQSLGGAGGPILAGKVREDKSVVRPFATEPAVATVGLATALLVPNRPFGRHAVLDQIAGSGHIDC